MHILGQQTDQPKQRNIDIQYDLSPFDLELWPTTFTYNPSLAKVKVDPHAKNEAQRSNGIGVRELTDRQTDTTKRIISLASRSIIK